MSSLANGFPGFWGPNSRCFTPRNDANLARMLRVDLCNQPRQSRTCPAEIVAFRVRGRGARYTGCKGDREGGGGAG